jgi:hypothetical protein
LQQHGLSVPPEQRQQSIVNALIPQKNTF